MLHKSLLLETVWFKVPWFINFRWYGHFIESEKVVCEMVRYQGEEGEGNLIFCCKGSRENHGHGESSFWLVAKIMIIILRFWVGTSKKKKSLSSQRNLCYHVNTMYIRNLSHLFILWFNNVRYTKCLFFMYFIVIEKKKIALEEI